MNMGYPFGGADCGEAWIGGRLNERKTFQRVPEVTGAWGTGVTEGARPLYLPQVITTDGNGHRHSPGRALPSRVVYRLARFTAVAP
jgi:hypothetical protein